MIQNSDYPWLDRAIELGATKSCEVKVPLNLLDLFAIKMPLNPERDRAVKLTADEKATVDQLRSSDSEAERQSEKLIGTMLGKNDSQEQSKGRELIKLFKDKELRFSIANSLMRLEGHEQSHLVALLTAPKMVQLFNRGDAEKMAAVRIMNWLLLPMNKPVLMRSGVSSSSSLERSVTGLLRC